MNYTYSREAFEKWIELTLPTNLLTDAEFMFGSHERTMEKLWELYRKDFEHYEKDMQVLRETNAMLVQMMAAKNDIQITINHPPRKWWQIG